MKDAWPWALGAIGVGLLFSRQAGDKAARKMTTPGREGWTATTHADLVDGIRQEARFAGIPEWLPLAMAETESRIRPLPPRGAGAGQTFYPFGIQQNRGQDLTGFPMGSDELVGALGPQEQLNAAVTEIARLWHLYGPDHERVRMGWVMPAYARRGRPFPEKTGSVMTARRMANWNRAVAKWGGPVPVA
jgi:hypothetical protein